MLKRKWSEEIYDTNTVRELESVANDFIYSIVYMQEPSQLVYVTTKRARVISSWSQITLCKIDFHTSEFHHVRRLFINWFFSDVS